MPEFNRPALLAASPVGALDPSYTPQQSPLVDNTDPFARAIDTRQQAVINAESKLADMEKLKDSKLFRLGAVLSGFGSAYTGRPSVMDRYSAQQDALHNQIAQGQAGIEDLNMQRYLLEQKAGPNIGTYNPRDYTPESWAQFVESKDPSALKRYDVFSQDGVRYASDGMGGARSLVTDAQRLSTGDIDAQIARLTKMREEMGKGEGQVAVGEDVTNMEANRAREVQNAKNNSNAADKMYTQAQTLRESLPNYSEAIAAIDEGASTGRVQGLLPSFRASTLRFEAAANNLGLNVIGQTTFGALSEGELKLAMETAVPRGMQGPELREWLMAKRAAEQKLIEELEGAAAFLEGGGSRAQLPKLFYGSGDKPAATENKIDSLGPPSTPTETKSVNWSDL